jgi:hypothetical protein
MAKRSAKFSQRKKSSTTPKNSLDADLKRRRGRPVKVDHSLVVTRSKWLVENLERAWPGPLGPALLAAQNVADVAKAFEDAHIGQVVSPELFPLLLTIVRDNDFPKRPKAQPRFLGESLAGWGVMSATTAREVCAAERKKPAPPRILRFEFWIECSCGYSGPSRDWGCPKCPAVIPLEWRAALGV